VRLTVVGCSPAFPNPGGAHSGYLIEEPEGEGSLLLDCGPGVLSRLRERERDGWPTVDAIVISHFHLDHCGDLLPWVWGSHHLRRLGEHPKRPVLWLPPGGIGWLERFGGLFGDAGCFAGPFDLREYGLEGDFDAAGHTVHAYPVEHYGYPANALRVTSPEGRTLAYSGDTSPCDGLVEAASGADLLLCEATLLSGEHDGEVRGHLGLEEAEEAFGRAGAGRLLVTHRPSGLPEPVGHLLARDGLAIEV